MKVKEIGQAIGRDTLCVPCPGVGLMIVGSRMMQCIVIMAAHANEDPTLSPDQLLRNKTGLLKCLPGHLQ